MLVSGNAEKLAEFLENIVEAKPFLLEILFGTYYNKSCYRTGPN
jgi:hypothetical protein